MHLSAGHLSALLLMEEIADCLCLVSNEVLKGLRLNFDQVQGHDICHFPVSTSRSPQVAEAQLAPPIYDELQLMILNR